VSASSLRTLGPLQLDGLNFKRDKPLLLLSYLCLEGRQARRRLAQLFWPGAANAMNSLAVAVGQLRRAESDLIAASETHLGTSVPCDVAAFRAALERGKLLEAAQIYQGPFLADLGLSEVAEELEEWVLSTREALAGMYRSALLKEARRQASSSQVHMAAQTASQAYRVMGAAPAPPELLSELHELLSAVDHPDVASIEQEARELKLPLLTSQTTLLGRRPELERILRLKVGETLWVCGAVGLGKSSLLRAAEARGGTLLLGRSGAAFQTLEPLRMGGASSLTPAAPRTAEAWTALLGTHRELLLLDDWEAADVDSRRVLLALAHSHAGPPLAISSRQRSPLGSESGLTELTLGPLPLQALGNELYAQTGGLPPLVQAARHGEPRLDAVALLVAPLTPRLRQLLVCLAFQEDPDSQITGAALELGPETLAEAQESLGRTGWLVEGQVVARSALSEWLATQPSLEAEVLMLLAPQLGARQALPLYLRAHQLTGSSSLPGFQAAVCAEAKTLLDQGQELAALTLLTRHAQTPEARLLQAQALHALGRHPEALHLLDALPITAAVQAARARTLFRLGQPLAAREAAQAALQGELTDRAQGHNVLGALGLAAQDYRQAKQSFTRACGVFRLLGDDRGALNALCMQAVAMTELGEETATLTGEIVVLSEQHQHDAQTLINVGWLLERQQQPEQALELYRRAAVRAQEMGQAQQAALAWNNVGALEQRLEHKDLAQQAYQAAIEQARATGEVQTLALVLGNLAELEESLPLLEEAIVLLRESGQDDLVMYFETQRAALLARLG